MSQNNNPFDFIISVLTGEDGPLKGQKIDLNNPVLKSLLNKQGNGQGIPFGDLNTLAETLKEVFEQPGQPVGPVPVDLANLSEEEIDFQIQFWTELKKKKSEENSKQKQFDNLLKQAQEYQAQFDQLHQELPKYMGKDLGQAQEIFYQMQTVKHQMLKTQEELEKLQTELF